MPSAITLWKALGALVVFFFNVWESFSQPPVPILWFKEFVREKSAN